MKIAKGKLVTVGVVLAIGAVIYYLYDKKKKTQQKAIVNAAKTLKVADDIKQGIVAPAEGTAQPGVMY